MAPPAIALKALTLPFELALTAPLTGALLLAILYYPEKVQSILAPVSEAAFPVVTSDRFITTLKALVGLGVLKTVNNKLSQYVINNFKSNAKFVKSQEIVLISGGCSGIGLLMATEFAKMGTKVVVLDLGDPKKPLPSGIRFFKCDVTKTEQIKEVAADIRKAVGDPTVLINNAGIGSGATILQGSEEFTRKTFEVNTMSHFWMVREFLPAMVKKNHGHVVTIASMASFLLHAGNTDYACTKASALAFHEGLSVELKSRYNAPNVRTTVVNPAWIRTPLIEDLINKPGFRDPVLEPEEVVDRIVKQVVSGKSGQLILPDMMYFLSSIRSWPSWLQYTVRNQIAHDLEGF